MPDDQFPTGSPQDPQSTHFAESQPLGAEPEITFEPLTTPAQDDAVDVVSIEGGQYPDDMFGLGDAADDDAAVTLPGEAIAGGLADVAYGNPGETLAPLPPPAEPQELADISIDPLPAPAAEAPVAPQPIPAEPVAEAPGGDMFDVNDLMDEPAAAAPGGDMFSVNDLMEEQTAPLATPDSFDALPPAAAEPLPRLNRWPRTVGHAGTAGDAPAAGSADPFAAPEPLATPEPLAPRPLAMPEPLAAPEPVAELPADGADAVVGPYGITDNQAEMGGSDFGFTAGSSAPEPPAEAAAEQPVFQPIAEPIVEPLGRPDRIQRAGRARLRAAGDARRDDGRGACRRTRDRSAAGLRAARVRAGAGTRGA